MPNTSTLQYLEHMLAEQKRILHIMKTTYPAQVQKGTLTPYTRDHRFTCIENTISLIEFNINNELKQNLCKQQQQPL
jgi:hypothetical protein